MEVVSASKAKRIDAMSINEIGIPGIVLMECAAQEIYSAILHKGEKFLVCCGVGNNGGDGLAIARKLLLQGKDVTVLICGEIKNPTEEFTINYNILSNLKGNILLINDEESINSELKLIIDNSDIIVDGIFGIGLSREVKGIYYKIIDLINSSCKYVVSIDVPSGLNCDTGEVYGICVKANETYTVEVYKKGFFMGQSSDFLGDLKVIKIGFPNEVIDKLSDKIRVLENKVYREMMPIRNKNSHKGDFGKVVVLAGSKGYTGAAFITTEATVRAGAGLVTLVVNKEIQDNLSGRLIEAMTVAYDEEVRINQLIKSADVIACGPGLGTSKESYDLLRKFLEESSCPIVLDADALNIVAKNMELLDLVKGRAVITPHPGEMSRLTNKSISEIERNRIDECKGFAIEHELVVLLKGYNTVISNGNEVIINPTGNSKMASGGMGDCLTGLIASLIAQKKDIFQSTVLGCYVHGLAADKLSKERYCINARDVIEEVPKIMEYI